MSIRPPLQITLFLLCALDIAAAARGEQELATIETPELSLEYPDTWRHIQQADTIATLLAPPRADRGFRSNIRVAKYALAGTSDLDRIIAAQVASAGREYKVIGSGELDQARTRTKWLATSEKQAEPGSELMAKVDYLMVTQTHLIVLHSMCNADDLAETRPIFDAVARSVRLRGQIASATNASTEQRPSNSTAYEQGKFVGQLAFIAIVVVLVLWLVKRAFQRVKK